MSWSESREFKLKLVERWLPQEPLPGAVQFSVRIGTTEIGIYFHPNFQDREAVTAALKPWRLMAVGVPNYKIEFSSVAKSFVANQPEYRRALGVLTPFENRIWNYEEEQIEVLKSSEGEDWIHNQFAAKQSGAMLRVVLAPLVEGKRSPLSSLLRTLFRRAIHEENYLSIKGKSIRVGERVVMFLDPSKALMQEIETRCAVRPQNPVQLQALPAKPKAAPLADQWVGLTDHTTTLLCDRSGQLQFVSFPDENFADKNFAKDNSSAAAMLPVQAIVRESFSGFLEVNRVTWREIFLEMVPLIRQHSCRGEEAHLLHKLADALMTQDTQFWTLSAKRGGQLISLIEGSLFTTPQAQVPPEGEIPEQKSSSDEGRNQGEQGSKPEEKMGL